MFVIVFLPSNCCQKQLVADLAIFPGFIGDPSAILETDMKEHKNVPFLSSSCSQWAPSCEPLPEAKADMDCQSLEWREVTVALFKIKFGELHLDYVNEVRQNSVK